MKLGQEVWIHGYIDEMRKDIAIIKNEGGYFGAVYDEILTTDEVVSCVSQSKNKNKNHPAWYRCPMCENNDEELSAECYECIKGIADNYEPKG